MAIVSLVAGETITAGNAVYVTSSGVARTAQADGADIQLASVAGVAQDTVLAGESFRCNVDSVAVINSAGFTPGEALYLHPSIGGQISDFATFASGVEAIAGGGLYLVRVGTALTEDRLAVELKRPIFVNNTTSIILMESASGLVVDAILDEDGFRIDTEGAL
tara:strand:+ start:96 stop:584 length:489 start_codon:yes stop_codon:yes gene_type:complete